VNPSSLKLNFSTSSRQDLEDIALYSIRKFGTRQAELYAKSIQNVLNQLCDNPNLGIKRDDLKPKLKSIVHVSHLIFYKVEGNHLKVLRILHHSQDLKQYRKWQIPNNNQNVQSLNNSSNSIKSLRSSGLNKTIDFTLPSA